MAERAVHRISDELYEFEDWRGQKYECIRGPEQDAHENREANHALLRFEASWNGHSEPEWSKAKGYRWFVYSGDLCFGSYLSPLTAAKVFKMKEVSVGGFFS